MVIIYKCNETFSLQLLTYSRMKCFKIKCNTFITKERMKPCELFDYVSFTFENVTLPLHLKNFTKEIITTSFHLFYSSKCK